MKLLFPLILLLLSCTTEPKDCAGVEGGSAFLDDCGICGGDNSTCLDCAGINTYQLADLNTSSSTFGQTLSHNDFVGNAILYYFSYSDT
jgi:hypothetical protein